MRTSQQWWTETKADPVKLTTWLRKQYHGECTAAGRIDEMSMECADPGDRDILMTIADQERYHAKLVKELLDVRNIDIGEHDTEARYWSRVKAATVSFEDRAAIATLAEGMRLERIRVISSDEGAPADIRDVFRIILVDEEWHEKAFAKMTDPATVEKLRPYHNLGREVLGLER
jgi:rubrerythrin